MVIATGESCLLVKIIAKTCVSLTDKQTNEQKSRLGRYYCKNVGQVCIWPMVFKNEF